MFTYVLFFNFFVGRLSLFIFAYHSSFSEEDIPPFNPITECLLYFLSFLYPPFKPLLSTILLPPNGSRKPVPLWRT
jgi:hypothetical protein